jgi:hypothetical protein
MMGSRGWKGASECDAFSRFTRGIRHWRPGKVRILKRQYWKRARKSARLQMRACASN